MTGSITTRAPTRRYGSCAARVVTVVAIGCGVLGITPAAHASVAAKDLSPQKLTALDYSEGVLDAAAMANVDPQVLVGQSQANVVAPSTFNPKICGETAGAASTNVVLGASLGYDTSSTSIIDAAFSLKTTKAAKQYLDAFAKIVKGCDTFALADASLTAAKAPKLGKVGDQVLVALATGTLPAGTPITGLQVLVRDGQFINYSSTFTANQVPAAIISKLAKDQEAALKDLQKSI